MSTTEDHKDAEVTQVYELGYLVLPSVTEDNIPKVVSNLVSIVEKSGGKPLDSEDPYLEDLAYAMSKTIGARKYVVNDAYVGWMKFEIASSEVEQIKIAVEKVEEILRTLLIKVPRETTFTFAAARKARAEKELALENPIVEVQEEALEAIEKPAEEVVVEDVVV
ncbi:MAG: 30S ribosomal protein S6 [Minisyncoccia bacterium]